MEAVEDANKTEDEKRIERKEDILCSIFGHSITIVLVLFMILGFIGVIGAQVSIFIAFGSVVTLVIIYLLLERVFVK